MKNQLRTKLLTMVLLCSMLAVGGTAFASSAEQSDHNTLNSKTVKKIQSTSCVPAKATVLNVKMDKMAEINTLDAKTVEATPLTPCVPATATVLSEESDKMIDINTPDAKTVEAVLCTPCVPAEATVLK